MKSMISGYDLPTKEGMEDYNTYVIMAKEKNISTLIINIFFHLCSNVSIWIDENTHALTLGKTWSKEGRTGSRSRWWKHRMRVSFKGLLNRPHIS